MIRRATCFLALACVAGCGPTPAGRLHSTTGPMGDTYIASTIGDASFLNPVLSSDASSSQINALVFNGLVKYDRDLKIVGDLAERLTVSPDGLTLTFFLRPNVFWHDGRQFSADDVLFTYQRLIDPLVKTPFSADYELVQSVTVLDNRTVRVRYRRPFAPAVESWMMGIIPRHVFAEGDFNTHPANRRPVGTGPYVFAEWKTDEKIVLRANPRYFEGRPPIARYMYRVIPDQSVQFLELRNQSIDELSLTPDQWDAYPQFFRHYAKFNYPTYAYTYLGFNLSLPMFTDRRMREAIARCLNRDEIIRGVLLGKGRSATGPFPPQSWAHDADVPGMPYDPAGAAALLTELGWVDADGDGWREKDGTPLAFTILTNQGNKMRLLTGEIIQQQLRKAGIKADLRVIEWSSFVHQFIDKRRFEAVLLGWSLGRDPDQYALWHSGQTREGQYNFLSYNNPIVDDLLEKGRTTFDQARRAAIYHRIHRQLAHDLPCVFLFYPEALVAVHNRFSGPEVAPAGIGWNFHQWSVAAQDMRYPVAYEP